MAGISADTEQLGKKLVGTPLKAGWGMRRGKLSGSVALIKILDFIEH